MPELNFLTYTNATAVPYGPVRYLSAVVALLLGLTLISNARADSTSCLAKVSSYVAELDELLSKVKYTLTPYNGLNERYFPFRDCEASALLDVVRGSRFIRSIYHHPRRDVVPAAISVGVSGHALLAQDHEAGPIPS
jgi:hypothetical protein